MCLRDIDHYRIGRDGGSGINDPNGWFEEPRDPIETIHRIVQVRVKTGAVAENLPRPFPESEAHGRHP